MRLHGETGKGRRGTKGKGEIERGVRNVAQGGVVEGAKIAKIASYRRKSDTDEEKKGDSPSPVVVEP